MRITALWVAAIAIPLILAVFGFLRASIENAYLIEEHITGDNSIERLNLDPEV